MSKLIFGNATIAAKRAGPITYLTATGSVKEDGETYDFFQLPFFIFPPQWAFLVKGPGTSDRKAGDSFSYTELIPYPADVDRISVQTETGTEIIAIEDMPFNVVPYADGEEGAVGQFSVFNRLGTAEYLIAKDDAILPGVYRKVFGPASYADCEAYVAEHAGK
ncbi:hypothetical protein [Agrobacterium larrymoorei]|uniref:Uncharacterized protein n=1 Tax=Agrobacterium larrymoorei TaxID=160699 RepID=A0AAF0KI03_9HYPH|nr:hypothetical protein [Agrobacterium larrymoorei]WHA39734.1 hypothetical protein CFBP5477_007665 [Agrobacterium larrymoorei]